MPFGRRQILKPSISQAVIDGNHPLAKALLGCWLLNEHGGLTAFDLTNRYGSGSLTSGPTWANGKAGPAVSFASASSQYITISHNANAGFTPANGFSIACRFKLNSNRNYNGLFAKTNSNIPGPFDTYIDSGGTLNFFYGQGSNSGSVTTSGLAANTWYDFIGTSNGTTGTIWLNGQSKATGGSAPSGVADTSNAMRIGSRNDGATFMDGYIEYAYLYNRTLIAPEIQQLSLDPYAFLAQPSRIRYFATPTAGTPVTVIYRKTLSLVGTRAGTRQVHN